MGRRGGEGYRGVGDPTGGHSKEESCRDDNENSVQNDFVSLEQTLEESMSVVHCYHLKWKHKGSLESCVGRCFAEANT